MSEAQAVGRFEDEFVGSAALNHRRLLTLVATVLCAASVTMVVVATPSHAALSSGVVELLIVGMPMFAGFYALRAGADRHFAYALIAVGALWSLTALGESSLSVPYTIGRLATWSIFPCVVYLLLRFPGQRFASRLEQALLVFMLAVVAILFYGTAPLVLAYPPHTLWATCTTDCPANAVALVHSTPAFLPNLILVREWLVIVLWAGLFWSMFRRFDGASPLRREALVPVFAAGTVLGVLHIAFHVSRELGAPAQVVVDLSTAWSLAIVAVCAAFFVGPLRRRMMMGNTLAQLWPKVRADSSPRAVRDAVAVALSDPSVELLFRDSDSEWHDERGRARAWPEPVPEGRAATVIGHDDVVMVHDAALLDDRELLDGVSDVVLAGWRHERLESDLADAMEDLERSRRRTAEAVDHERARIERDLHDGVQQRLLAVGMRLSGAQRRFQINPSDAMTEINDLRVELDRARQELRSLAHGVYPAMLLQSGVVSALEELRLQSPLPVEVAGDYDARYPSAVESAVYFTCVEALQNAMKHAAGATAVSIRVHPLGGRLAFEVLDDGAGIRPDATRGHGLDNMHERIEALGGRLTIGPAPDGGTRVAG